MIGDENIVKFKKNMSMLLFCGCVLFVISCIPHSFHPKDKLGSVKEGRALMEQLAKRDVATIEQEIRSTQERYMIQHADILSFSTRFHGSLIMGDSLSAGLLEYGLLPDNLVLANRGRRVDNMDEDIATAIGYAPNIIFLQYGINDLTYCRGDANRFTQTYSGQVKKLIDALPNTKIYINSLTPIAQTTIDREPYYGSVDAFNQALKVMCDTLDVKYIDNTDTINFTSDAYEVDGIHPYRNYYPLWMIKMLQEGGL